MSKLHHAFTTSLNLNLTPISDSPRPFSHSAIAVEAVTHRPTAVKAVTHRPTPPGIYSPCVSKISLSLLLFLNPSFNFDNHHQLLPWAARPRASGLRPPSNGSETRTSTSRPMSLLHEKLPTKLPAKPAKPPSTRTSTWRMVSLLQTMLTRRLV